MINGNITEFVDKLNYGEELLFEYDGKLFFLQGWISNGMAHMVLDEQRKESFTGYVWECEKEAMRDCAEAFLNAEIWDKKSFMQIEREVIWKD